MKRIKILWLRYSVQSASLIFFLLLFSGLSYPLGKEVPLLQGMTRLDPWTLLNHLRWQWNWPTWGWLSLATVLVSLVWGRLFCGWLCPLGAALTLVDQISRRWWKNLTVMRRNMLEKARTWRYFWLLLLTVVFLLGSNWTYFLTPFTLLGHEIVRGFQGQIPWILLGIAAGTVFFSRLWCTALCPTGLLLSVAARGRRFGYRPDKQCLECGVCSRNCPAGMAPVTDQAVGEGCLVCGDCQRSCPPRAIQWQRLNKKAGVTGETGDAVSCRPPSSRRQFIKTVAVLAAAVAFWQQTVWSGPRVLRPPGALAEKDFTAVCNRCGRCIRVCPAKALQPMPAVTGLANFETPYILPRKSRCDLCLSCQEVCPTGAIAATTLEQVRMGTAVLDKPRCIAWSEQKLCLICAEQCPVLAIQGDENHRPVVLAEQCVGCGSCENACPVAGDAAVRVLPRLD
ncbi:MAG TPA: 4Fe-4S dicluster domain-containing protein [Patescibacteria group bacterium]|nr:4Fe-4S dicluster domain-containing protein [Patescibacteria group bacterium]